jgi:hypothetical protein
MTLDKDFKSKLDEMIEHYVKELKMNPHGLYIALKSELILLEELRRAALELGGYLTYKDLDLCIESIRHEIEKLKLVTLEVML